MAPRRWSCQLRLSTRSASKDCSVSLSWRRSIRKTPTAILVGWGMQRRLHGGAIVRALDALSAISGNLSRPGGGCSFYYQRRAPFADLATGAAARHVREPMFGHDVLAAQDPPIRAIWVTAGNPVAMAKAFADNCSLANDYIGNPVRRSIVCETF